MTEITFQGDPLTLSGSPPNVGDEAPSFTVHEAPGEPVKFAPPLQRPVVLTTAPSVDTPVCASQLRSFDERLESGAENRQFDLWFVSRDLPFALDRFGDEHDIELARTLSDYNDRALGEAFGLEVRELGLLARAVFTIDTDGRVTYRELVGEIADQPDYEAAIRAVAELTE